MRRRMIINAEQAVVLISKVKVMNVPGSIKIYKTKNSCQLCILRFREALSHQSLGLT